MNEMNVYKGRTFAVGSAIGAGSIPHRAEVIESYNTLCLVKVTKSFVSGPFVEYGIYQVVKSGSGEESLSPMNIDYSVERGVPAKYAGTEQEVKSKFEQMVSAAKLKFFESELRENEKLKVAQAAEASAKIIQENRAYLKARLSEINTILRQECSGTSVEKLASDKKITSLINERFILESLKKF